MRKDLAISHGVIPGASLRGFIGTVEETLGLVLKKEILDGSLLRDVILSSTAVEIPHKLGRDISGFIVVRARTWDATNGVLDEATPFTGTVHESQSEDSTKFIKLYSSADVLVNVWVF